MILLGLTVGVSILAESNAEWKYRLLFNAYRIKHHKEWYRWITHGLVHGGWMHLLVNMYVFYNFGEYVEYMLLDSFGTTQGRLIFLALYVGGFIVSSISSYLKHQDNEGYNSLGASGGVASVLFAFIIFQPTHSLILIFLPFLPIPAFVLGGLYLWYESHMAKRGGTGIAHDAHFWGAVYGIALLAILDFEIVLDCIMTIKAYLGAWMV